MSNLQNLRAFSPQQARKYGSKGGSVNSIAQKMRRRELCCDKCPMWDNCWAKHEAESLHQTALNKIKANKKTSKKEKTKLISKQKKKCYLKQVDPKIQERTFRLLSKGEEGFIEEMQDVLTKLGMILMRKTDSNAYKEYLKEIRETHKSIFGDKRRFEGKIDGDALSATSFAAAWKAVKDEEAKEKKVTPTKPKVKKKSVRVKGKKDGNKNQGNRRKKSRNK